MERDDDVNSSLARLRARKIDAVIVLLEEGRSKYYVRRSGDVLVETRLEDVEHPEALPVKIAEGVRSALRTEQERETRSRASPAFALSLGPVLAAASYAQPRLGFEGIALWRLTDRFYLGPRAKGTLSGDYGEPNSELGASTIVFALTGCTPFPVAPVVTVGLCASLGARAIYLNGIRGPQKDESGGQIWGPLFGGAFFADLELNQHFALRSSFNLDLGFGSYSGPDSLPKRSTDLLADHSASAYFGLDVGLGFYLVYLVR